VGVLFFMEIVLQFIEIVLKVIETIHYVFSHLLGICLVAIDQNI